MEIREITEKKIWEDFLLKCKDKTFLQSWNWGDFQRMMGNKIWRLGIFENEKLTATALISKIGARRGKFFLIQHGPNISSEAGTQRQKIVKALLKELKRIGKKEGVSFIRMSPLWLRTEENKSLLKKLGFKEAPMHANAYEATWKLDLSPSEKEILVNMRKTTRYLIRQALKNEKVTLEHSEDLKDVEIYQKLNEEVARRHKFVPFSLEYVKNEFKAFSKDRKIQLIFGKYKREVVAAALVIFWSGIGFYHQAASAAKHKKLSLPYLLQWQAIKEAKKRGCSLYDFWGFVDPKKEPRHPWAGPTLFKMGFGGKAYEYLKTQDFPFSKKYWLTYFFEKLRKTKRGL
jgi:peptidoglycan pentaglycine glycine transferase (the first glycine)